MTELHPPDAATFLAERFRDLGPDERIEVRTFRPDGKPGPRFWSADPAEAARRALALPGPLNVFYGVNLRCDRGGKKAHVTRINGLYADLDFKHFATGEEGAWAMLRSFPIRPTWVIHSGNGLHAYWDFDAPLGITGPDDPTIGRVEGLLSRLYAHLGGIDSVQDISRVLRFPGSFNAKGDPPLPVTIARHHPDARYTLADFEALLPAPAPAPPPAAAAAHPPPAHDTPTLDQLRDMLRCIPPQGDYKDHWLRILAAVHSAYPGPEGIAVCEEWSPGLPGEIARKFASFGRYRGQRGPATIATVIYEAKRGGYQPPRATFIVPPAPAASDAGAAPDELRARVAALEREVAGLTTALDRCREEHARKDARLAALEQDGARKDARIAALVTKVKALDACIAHPDQTVGGAAPDIAEAVAAAYQRGDTLVRDGKEYARLVNKQASKRRSATTIGRAVKAIGAARPEDIFTRAEPLETDRFKGTVDISYIHVPPERRRDDADIALYVLPPATKKRHGGDHRIAVPREVAAQDAPVRRETRRVERFFSLVTDAQLGVIEGKPFIDFCAADGTPMTAAEAEAFQVAIGAQPPPPPRYRPTQSRLQDARKVSLGTSVQDATDPLVGTSAPDPAPRRVQDATDPEPVPLFRNRGCRNPNCDRAPVRGGYCAAHHPDNWGDYLAQREYTPRGGPAYERVVLDA